ncbi:alpha/beta fold hydrolase [Paraburkholderia fungorum]|uniref:alpha/beta fold hydrolase n=1 Tax=Paraburkholderia fungorum TaxID=134537 RepID=UPI001C1E9727|nr:alpha/beta hydrolase [Paraburkholderia fungorum]MBU7443501.1 alpha/beta hydrolase [Paraburkholderia fungorum]
MTTIHSRYVSVNGIRTHYLEAGAGPTVVLLHSGEFGGAAEISWEFNVSELAKHFHVIAPDWLGFGRTDKVVDFADPRGRVFQHMIAFIDMMRYALNAVGAWHFIGNSMGASNLLKLAADRPRRIQVKSIIAASGGGFAPLTPAREALLAYDGSTESMRAVVGAMFHSNSWKEDEAYIAKRQQMALLPGAWQAAASARLRLPGAEGPAAFGKEDTTAYELIDVPTLLIAGAQDQLRLPGYADELSGRIAGSRVRVFKQCGHCANIECADEFNALVIDFIKGVEVES